MPIEDCPICSKIPATCHRENVDCEVVDDRPPEMLRLEAFVKLQHEVDGDSSGQIDRCPTCHRLYLNDTRFVAPTFYFDYESTWRRHDVDELFATGWCVARAARSVVGSGHWIVDACHRPLGACQRLVRASESVVGAGR